MEALEKESVVMKFCLTYDGPLPSNPDSRSCLRIKHDIRREIHYQLKDLVEEHDHAIGGGEWKLHDIGDITFVPLVISEFYMLCELDILFLRREKQGSLITKPKDEYGGDLDNRLKIFLDALRVPQEPQELPKDVGQDGERMLYCLLEDDSLISRFQVNSQTLLGKHGPQAKGVRLIIDVTIRVTRYTKENRYLSSG